MSIESALKVLRKQSADAFKSNQKVEAISTGSYAVDLITGIGGFPVGRISEVFGWEASGKTTLCLQSFAQAQRDGLRPAYLDPEIGVDPTLAAHVGCEWEDPHKGIYLNPQTFEETMDIVEALVKHDAVNIVFIDSVSAMVPKSAMEAKLTDTSAIALAARLMADQLPKLTKIIEAHRVAVVFVNQLRKTIPVGYTPGFMVRKEDTEQSSGGSALKFYSSMRINMTLATKGVEKRESVELFTGKDEKVALANMHVAKVIKNKLAPPYRQSHFLIRYDEARNLWGIDNVMTYFKVGVVTGVVQQKGAFFSFDALTGVQGEDEFLVQLRATPDVVAKLRAAIDATPQVQTFLGGS